MKLLRFSLMGRHRWGVLSEDGIRPLEGEPYEQAVVDDRVVLPRDAVHLLPAVAPSKIVCVGRNYAEHAKELGNEVPAEPLLFLKPPSALLADDGSIVLPPQSQRVEHEGELAVVIGRTARRIAPGEAAAHILGYTCFNDVTARDLQRRDVQFTRAKGFDTFAPCGPHIETELDPRALNVETRVNGALRQQGNTAQMMFPVWELVAYVSEIMTLLPGDVIATGTPAGVGPLEPGDRVEVTIEGIGTLVSAVRRPK